MDVVPWVVMWSGEADNVKPFQKAPWGLVGPRDKDGILWIQFPFARGMGLPLFGHVHTDRQIRCMRGPLCQVCAKPMDEATWVLNGYDIKMLDEPELLTITPPTCRACAPKAFELCPHLSAIGKVLVKVEKYTEAGLFGDFYPPNAEPIQMTAVHRDDNNFDSYKKWFLARQLIVRFDEYSVEEM